MKPSLICVFISMQLYALMWMAVATSVHTCKAANDSVLYSQLFDTYESAVFPSCGDDCGATEVQVGAALRQIIEFDEPTQIMKAYLWIRLIWSDCRLTWNETETNVSFIAVPYKNVWTPDITLYESADGELSGLKDYRPTIYPDGTIYYNFPTIITLLCKVDVTYFPFDQQNCQATFGSWAYSGLAINLTERTNAADISSYIENGEWELRGFPSERHETFYGCCPEPYPDVSFYIKLQRRSRFYTLNLIFPCCLMAAMALLGFVLPPDSGEKVSLEITVLLSLAVFMLMVSEIMPPTSDTFPYIGMYFAAAMLLVSLSCVTTVIVLAVHHKGSQGRKLPAWLNRVFIQGVGPILLVSTDSSNSRGCYSCNRVENGDADKVQVISNANVHIQENGLHVTALENMDAEYPAKNNLTVRTPNDKSNSKKNSISSNVDSVQSQQLACMLEIKAMLDEKQIQEEIDSEWQILARVLDRVFILAFLLMQIIATMVIMLKISL